MPYTYDAFLAADPNNPAVVAKNAAITIFDPADSTESPVTITDPTGSPIPNPVTVNAQGFGPAFQHATLDRVGWKGAGFLGYFTSYEGMRSESVAAKEAAQNAANEAATAAADRVTAAAVNGAGKLILTKATGATVDAGSVIGPKGDKGDKGADGSNVLPTSQAIAQEITTPGTPTATALNATYEPVGAAVLAVTPVSENVEAIDANRTARDARTLAAKFNLATDTLAALSSTGLTTTSGYIAASVGGTDGNAIFPVWGRKNVRASFRVKVTKGTAGSKSAVGFTTTAQGTIPTTQFMFSIGYLQGTGIAVIRDNVGAAVSIIADASLTDGEEYDISFSADTELSARGTTTGIISALCTKVSTGAVTRGAANFNLSSFPINNMLVRTNVAAGSITNLQMSLHAAGEVGLRSSLEVPYSTVAAETAFIDVPAKPNGKLVIACHGHGGTPTETGYTSVLYKPTWDALTAAGFTVAVPKMGGDIWGNDTAQAFLAELHAQLTSLYGLDPNVFLWGNSMGGGASQTAIAKKTIPVAAAYLAQPVCDLSTLWSNPSFPTLPAAYGNSTTERDDNNPMTQPASAFAGVPLLYVASAADTTVNKAPNTDAMRTKLGSVTRHYLITATGNHMDASHYRPRDTLEFFRANMG